MTAEEEARALLDRLIEIEEARGAEIKETLGEAGLTGDPSQEFFLNPNTGQMTSRELLRNAGETSRGQAFAGGVMQGSTFQFGDELAGAAGAVEGAFRTGIDPAAMAKFRMEEARAMLERDREQHPGWAAAGEIAGVAPYAVTTGAAMARAPTLLSAAGQGAGMGAMEGFAYGAGRGEGLEGRAGAALSDAILGAGMGAVAPYAVAGVRGVGRAGLDLVEGGFDALTDRANAGRAGRAMARTLDTSGLTIPEIEARLAAAANAGQPEYRVMDAMGEAGQRRVNGVVRSGGPSGAVLADFLDTRQSGATDRMAGMVKEHFNLLDPSSDTAAKIKDALIAQRSRTAEKAYDAARASAGPVNLNDAIAVIDDALNLDPILGENASSLTRSDLGRKLLNLRGKLQAGGEQLIDFGTVLQIKSDLFRLGQRAPLPKPLRAVYDALDSALEAASDNYRFANDTYRAQSGVIDAVDLGRSMANPGRAEDTIATLRNMPASEVGAARQGYGDKLLERIDTVGPTGDATRPVIGRPKVRKEVGAIANDPAQLLSKAGREKDMFDTFQMARTGSNTASNLADMDDMVDAAGVLDVMRGGVPNASGLIGRALDRALPVLQGQNDATRRLIVDMLMSRDPQVLMPGVSAQVARDTRERIIQALLRGTGRERVASASD